MAGVFAFFEKLGKGAIGGLLLLVAAVVAIVVANSGLKPAYDGVLGTYVTAGISDFAIHKPLALWINDGLMALFFLLVGLEIKRELLEGSLSSAKAAALPAFAALGGMIVPAIIYAAFNFGDPTMRGWAIPAATDIAFALGIISLLGNRVPLTLKVFLTTLAVVDDLGAVIIIALFYTAELKTQALMVAAIAVCVLIALNRLGVRRSSPFVLVGIVLWVAVLKSGVHATIAGVLLALTIPARRIILPGDFADRIRKALLLRDREDSDEIAPDTQLHHVRHVVNDTEPLLLRWEHGLQPWVMFLIMPVFAFANAGVSLEGVGFATLAAPASLGVGLGLLLGKPIGVTLFSWLAVRIGIAERPSDVSWAQIHGASWLAGIGFTMSLFIASLAFDGSPEFLNQAKIGLLSGSFVAGVIGVLVLMRVSARSN